MPRQDLLALSFDDLAAMTNRGTAKRAQREVEAGEFTCQWTESESGDVFAAWSDDVRCTFPAGKTIQQGRCTCVSTTLCRHLVRSIFAYQALHATAPAAVNADPGSAAPTAAEPAAHAAGKTWDPGQISDDELTRHLSKPVLTAARANLADGLLVELLRGPKPTARFHQLGCTLRFMVPNDPRYTLCDCAQASPCGHVPLAVWAFRQLPPDQDAGFVSTQQNEPAVPTGELNDIEALLRELAAEGIAHVPPTWKDRIIRLTGRCQSAGLVWPGEILAELTACLERYRSRDARFDPELIVDLAGECLIRCDAIRSSTRAVPQPLIRGTTGDRPMDIGAARYIGLGCGVRLYRGGVEINAFVQHADSGTVAAIGRDFADPTADNAEPPKDFYRLAETPIVKSVSLAATGLGQVLLQGGRRSADHRLAVGRSKASINPQAFAWEALRPPVLVEDFAELRARLSLLPPASLRPRYVAANLHVCPTTGVDAFQFNHATQAVEAVVRDARGQQAFLRHPYHARAAGGVDAVLQALADPSRRLCFVAGQTRVSGGDLEIAPIALVFEGEAGRTAIQPWVQRPVGAIPATPPLADIAADRVAEFPLRIRSELAELFLLGLRRQPPQSAARWRELAASGEAAGYDRLPVATGRIAAALSQKASSVRWDERTAVNDALLLALLCTLARDVEW